MIGLLVWAASVASNRVSIHMQGRYASAQMIGRVSDGFKLVDEQTVQVVRKVSEEHRVRRRRHNAGITGGKAKAAPPVHRQPGHKPTPPPPIGDVSLRVLDEMGNPQPGIDLLVLPKDSDVKAIHLKSDSSGEVTFKHGKGWKALAVSLGQGQDDWTIEGGEFDVDTTHPENVPVLREYATFELAKAPAGDTPKSLESAEPRVFVGDSPVSLEDAPDHKSWSFRVKREDIGEKEKPCDFVVQYEQGDFGYGGRIHSTAHDFYSVNPLTNEGVKLESVKEAKVTLAGQPISEGGSHLSPIYWYKKDSEDAPKLVTGNSALEGLGAKITPAYWPKIKNDKYRYGGWLQLKDKGLALRVRSDNGFDVLPAEKENGIVEAIRVLRPEGGDIGETVRVGATKSDVLATLGRPDVPLSSAQLQALGLAGSPKEVNLALFGDATYEAWDDSFLYGGIRIKWDAGDRVKWFEIARPIQLLYQGTRAFNPIEPDSLFCKVITASGDEDGGLEREVKSGFERAAGTKTVNSEADASVVVTAHISEVQTAKGELVAQTSFTDKKGKTYITPAHYDWTGFLTVRFTVTEKGVQTHTLAWSVSSGYSQKVDVSDSTAVEQVRMACLSPQNRGQIRDLEEMNGKSNTRYVSLGQAAQRAATFGSHISATVLAVNHQTGAMLLNIGSKQGVRPGGEMNLELKLLHRVNPSDGAALNGAQGISLDGSKNKESHWIEVLEGVGEDWCVARPMTLKKTLLGNKSGEDFAIMPALVDPGSGLARAYIQSSLGR